MVFMRSGLVILLTALSIKVLPYLFAKPKLPFHFGGRADRKFGKVARAFKENFELGWEKEGAAFAVFHHGELVVDLWGGYADQSAMRKWRENTITTVFSVTKAVSSLCIAYLVDKGKLDYNQLVTDIWPEFGQNGKENVTLAMLVNHEAGLAVLDNTVELEDIKDPKKMSQIFEEQEPNWKPGTAAGYHAVSMGWLVDQIVRRTDDKQRSVGEFFRDEIATPHSLDIHIGLPSSEEHRVAYMSQEGIWGVIGQILDTPIFAYVYYTIVKIQIDSNCLFSHLFRNFPWMRNLLVFNNPEIHALEIPAASGIATARDLAKLFSLALDGTLISKETLDLIRIPTRTDEKDLDLTMQLPTIRGHGFIHTKPPGEQKTDWQFGHPGFGGSSVKVDVANQLTFAYVTNDLKVGLGDLTRTFAKLQKALYESI